MTAEDGTVHPGSYCAPIGATGKTTAGTGMVCSIGDKGGRARWRRNGPAPARSPRRRARKSTATGGTLPQVNTGIDPTKSLAPVPAAADTAPPVDALQYLAQQAGKGQPVATAPIPTADVTARIRDAYRDIAPRPGEWIKIGDLRKKLPDIPRADLDRAIEDMLTKDDNIAVEAEIFGHRLDDEARNAAVVIANLARHKFVIFPR